MRLFTWIRCCIESMASEIDIWLAVTIQIRNHCFTRVKASCRIRKNARSNIGPHVVDALVEMDVTELVRRRWVSVVVFKGVRNHCIAAGLEEISEGNSIATQNFSRHFLRTQSGASSDLVLIRRFQDGNRHSQRYRL